jgi:hypothetical protein
LWAGTAGKTFMTVAAPLSGASAGVEMTPAHDRFLRLLQRGPAKRAVETDFVRSLFARASLFAGRADLLKVIDDLRSSLNEIEVPSTIVHGDFAPWNLRVRDGEIFAYDWEYATLDGLPLIDEFHHLLAVGYLLKKWTGAQAADALSKYGARSMRGLSPNAVRALQQCYVLDYLLRLFDEGYDDRYPRVVWLREILTRLLPVNAADLSAAGGAS